MTFCREFSLDDIKRISLLRNHQSFPAPPLHDRSSVQLLLRYRDLILTNRIIACLVVILCAIACGAHGLDVGNEHHDWRGGAMTTIYVKTPLEISIFPSMFARHHARPTGAERRRHDAADFD